MEDIIIARHRKQLDRIREICGEENYAKQLDAINNAIAIEVDDDLKWLFEQERERVALKYERSKSQDPCYETTITDGKQKCFKFERNKTVYSIKALKKNEIFNDTIMYCLVTGRKLSDLKAADYTNIGMSSYSDSNNVSSTLSRIISDDVSGKLTNEEKDFFYNRLAQLNATDGIMEKFPCLAVHRANAG